MGGVFPLLLLLLLLLCLLLLLLLLPTSSPSPTPPLRCGSIPPPPHPVPPCLPPTQFKQHLEGHVGVIPQHPPKLRDPHQERAGPCVMPLDPHPAGVPTARGQADNL